MFWYKLLCKKRLLLKVSITVNQYLHFDKLPQIIGGLIGSLKIQSDRCHESIFALAWIKVHLATPWWFLLIWLWPERWCLTSGDSVMASVSEAISWEDFTLLKTLRWWVFLFFVFFGKFLYQNNMRAGVFGWFDDIGCLGGSIALDLRRYLHKVGQSVAVFVVWRRRVLVCLLDL